MLEPVALKDFFITFFSSALIVMAGASYALLFAWSKVKPRLSIKLSAYISYLILLISVYQLTLAANLDGYWRIISYLMVIGYFFAPIAIWHLCKSTHDESDLITPLEKNNE
ncbi:MAG: hypothetical protein KAH20_12150 [Methylococcales bacterium]|nr:hypothetical protein [Methylococcales bacterium]